MKAINKTWFNNSKGCIGVVLAENEYGQKAYISSVPGHDEESDVRTIMDWGARISRQQAEGFFPGQIDEEKYEEN